MATRTKKPTSRESHQGTQKQSHHAKLIHLLLLLLGCFVEATIARLHHVDQVCIGTSNRLYESQPSANKSDLYQNLAERYKDKNCTSVIGNLEITWLDKSLEPDIDLSFLESIREISGYLLIAHVKVDKIRLPNLQIIRGRDLFKLNNEQGEKFALFLDENELKTLELPKLREIQAGSVGFFNNKNLCHVRTINWEEILTPTYKSVFVYSGTEPVCPPCNQLCPHGCWAEGADMCQEFTKISCSKQCNDRCFGTTANECCHSHCAAGCSGPKQSDCFACKNFYHDGECIQECPSMHRYNPTKFLWEPNPNGTYAFGPFCVKECPGHLLRDNGACVRTCPPSKRNINGECVTCPDPCPKNCQGVEVVHSGNIDQLINCTVIEGSISILDSSFTGQVMESSLPNALTSNGSSLSSTKYLPMHPNRLDVLKNLIEITGYLNIQANHPEFKNLSFLRNLKYIHGKQTTDLNHSLSITKSSLVSLNLRSLRKVHAGKIIIEDNKDLCFADTIDWTQTNISKREDIITRNNADNSKCHNSKFRCHEQCARDGCWGPGPDECLSCKNYRLDDVYECVDDCTSIQGVLSFYAGSNTCKKCHSECKTGCFGTEANECSACKHVKDGPYCVSECPKHKYNNSGICQECNKGCSDGCTGPSNKLGLGGCNSCSKTVLKHGEKPAYCIRSEDPCPEGYYQEFFNPLSEGNLKLIGTHVCRKCHHRCKSCTGIGSHTSVCKCAKYVAGEQCEDFCPRDFYADKEKRQCFRCSSECNGCTGPTEADCISCRVYRIYHDESTNDTDLQSNKSVIESPLRPISSALVHLSDAVSSRLLPVHEQTTSTQKGQTKFSCTAQCPPDKPHRISESNMLDPYCSEYPGLDTENPRIVSLSGASLVLVCLFSTSIVLCFLVYRCQIEKNKTVKLTMRLSGIDDVEPLNPSNLKPNLSPLRSIKETELRKGNILGSGFGGTVYQGFWFPEGQEHKKPKPVAIKELRDNGQSNMNKEFLDEAYIMASVNHPNLVRLLAVCTTPKHKMLVTQLMPLGCLLYYVRNYKNEIGAKNLLEWCKQIARGMSYLEEHRMVHRDLALRNVLLQTSGRAMISDFGLAKFLEIDQSEYQSGGGRMPIKWLAPECFRERKFTHKSDVWAFGVTVWELLTFGQAPFDEYTPNDVPAAIEKGARLKHPDKVSTEVYKVMYACWFYHPEDRPNFKSLAEDFVIFARDPGRYLAQGKGKGISYSSRKHLVKSLSDINRDCAIHELEDQNNDELYSSECNSLAEEGPMTGTIPDLTPNTHNRLNEIKFGFEMRHQQAVAAAAAEQALKHMHHVHNHHIDSFPDEIDGSNVDLVVKRQNQFATDVNNNSTFIPPGSNRCSVHHSMSNTSLGLRSEQPTDFYNYLVPSPCTHAVNPFGSYYEGSCEPKSVPMTPLAGPSSHHQSMRNPPHSAGVMSVNNEEYFSSSRAFYVNQQQKVIQTTLGRNSIKSNKDNDEYDSRDSMNDSQDDEHCHSLDASNGDILHSLV